MRVKRRRWEMRRKGERKMKKCLKNKDIWQIEMKSGKKWVFVSVKKSVSGD